MLPLLGVLTHLLDQNNTKDMENTGINNSYVIHLSILNPHFKSLKPLHSSHESPFTVIRKKIVLRFLGKRNIGSRAESWPKATGSLGRQGTFGQCRYWFCSTRFFSQRQNTSWVSCIPLNVPFPLNTRCFRKERANDTWERVTSRQA